MSGQEDLIIFVTTVQFYGFVTATFDANMPQFVPQTGSVPGVVQNRLRQCVLREYKKCKWKLPYPRCPKCFMMTVYSCVVIFDVPAKCLWAWSRSASGQYPWPPSLRFSVLLHICLKLRMIEQPGNGPVTSELFWCTCTRTRCGQVTGHFEMHLNR